MNNDKSIKGKRLYDFSENFSQKEFDVRNINKSISDLSLEDYNWCIRNRYFLNQIIDLTIYEIEKNWDKIDKYYSSKLSQWYEDAIKEIITIPFEFWDYRIDAFKKIKNFIQSSTKREFAIETSIIELFVSHIPKPKNWTIDDSKQFLNNLSYAQGMDLIGHLMEAFNQVKQIKYAIMYGQSVYIETTNQSLSNEKELYKFIRDEYSEFGELVEKNILEPLKKEKIIKL